MTGRCIAANLRTSPARKIVDRWTRIGQHLFEQLSGRAVFLLRLLKGAASKFCTSRAQFAILGAENCEQRRYRSEKFIETAAPEEGKLVYEFFDSAFGPAQRAQP